MNKKQSLFHIAKRDTLPWYKSFAIGFCSGLVWMGARSHVLLFSLLHILPQNLFLNPGFFLSAHGGLSSSLQNSHRRYAAGRPFAGNSVLPTHSGGRHSAPAGSSHAKSNLHT